MLDDGLSISDTVEGGVSSAVGGMVAGVICAWVAGRRPSPAPLWLAATVTCWLSYMLLSSGRDHARELGAWVIAGNILGILGGAALWNSRREIWGL